MKEFTNFGDTVLRMVYFVKIEFDSGEFLANSSDKNLTYNEKLYYGVGSFGKMGEYETISGTEATSLKFTLTNIASDVIGEIVEENTRNKRVTVSVALFDNENNMLVNPIDWFIGSIDSLTIDIGQVVSIAASASSRLLHWAMSVNSRYTDEDQQSKYEGDRGFKFVSSMSDLKLRWGS